MKWDRARPFSSPCRTREKAEGARKCGEILLVDDSIDDVELAVAVLSHY